MFCYVPALLGLLGFYYWRTKVAEHLLGASGQMAHLLCAVILHSTVHFRSFRYPGGKFQVYTWQVLLRSVHPHWLRRVAIPQAKVYLIGYT